MAAYEMIDGFSIDLHSLVFVEHKLASFDLIFGEEDCVQRVGHFENPIPVAGSYTNQNYLDWNHDLPKWIIDIMREYKDNFGYATQKDPLSNGMEALIRNLMEIITIHTALVNQPDSKSLIYGFNDKRELCYVFSDSNLVVNPSNIKQISKSFKLATGANFAGVYDGRGFMADSDLKRHVALTLRFRRLMLDLTLNDVVTSLEGKGIKLTTASLSRFENNLRHPDFETLVGLFNVLGIKHMDGYLNYFEQEYIDVLVDDEYDDFEFAAVNTNNLIRPDIVLDEQSKIIAGYLIVLFWGFYLDYRDKNWIKASEIPVWQWVDDLDDEFNLDMLIKSGVLETSTIDEDLYVSLNFDAFLEEPTLNVINELKDKYQKN